MHYEREWKNKRERGSIRTEAEREEEQRHAGYSHVKAKSHQEANIPNVVRGTARKCLNQ